jgi:outer membrane receptor protein involved in Fe transport
MNSSLFQTPAPISVLTKEFLDDIGAENTQDILKVAMSSVTERADSSGTLQEAFDTRANIRGFVESTITRDYLPNMVQSRGILASDLFNVDRADLSRGPNSVLYGAGRPGGAINTSSKRAVLNGSQKSVSLTMGRWNKTRSEVDLAIPLIKDALALRANTLLEDRNGWWEFEMLKQKGLALAVTYRPFKFTEVRAGVERVLKDQVQSWAFPHSDSGYSRWIKAGSPMAGNPLLPGTNPAPGLLTTANALQGIYAPQLRSQPFRVSTTGADMRPDLPGNQPTGYWQPLGGASAPIGGTVDDPFYGQVIPANAFLWGPGRTSNTDYTLSSLFIDQRIGDLSVELGYALSYYHRGFTGGGANAIGDPNPVIPGAYFADGDSVIATGRNPGTLLPDIGRTNPFAGGLYVQSQRSQQVFDSRSETMRASVGYELNLNQRSRWLGRHSLAGFLQKDRSLLGSNALGEYNMTPNNAQPIDSPTNTILRRTYLDFVTAGGVRGALDPAKNPIPSSPGMTAGLAWTSDSPWLVQENSSWMIAMQSNFLVNRLVLTAGYRRDRVELNSASAGGERLPNSTNLWKTRSYIFKSSTANVAAGPTKTFGAVLTPLPWLGFSYNQSESFFPQGGFMDLYDRFLDPVKGRGKDYGIRFNVLEGRLSVNVNSFQNTGVNQFADWLTAPRNQILQAVNAILTALQVRRQALPPSLTQAGLTQLGQVNRRETVAQDGKGTEIEVTGRIIKGWSASLNYSRNRLLQTNIAPGMNSFLAGVKGLWDRNPALLDDTPATVATFVRTRDNTPGRDFVLNPASFSDAYNYAVSVMTPANLAEGKAPLTQIETAFNVFTSYRFESEAWSILRQSRIGMGANYRGPAVIGYDATKANDAFRGKSSIVANVMLGKRFPLRKNRAIDVQINLDNVFKQEDLLPYSAVAPGNVVRYLQPATRYNWTLRTKYTF